MQTGQLMTFGKHKGLPVEEVPLDYLTWALDTLPFPPAYVVEELRRRGDKASGGASFLAYAAVSKHMHRSARRQACKKRTGGTGRRRAKAAGRKDVQRQEAEETHSRLKRGVWIVGEHFKELRAKWEAEGGDPSSCPFDADDAPLSEADEQATAHLKSITQEG